MTIRVVIILIIALASCTNEETPKWKSLDLGVFKVTTPSDWRIVKQNGVDSYFGGLTNGKDSLWFDYGWYPVDLGDGPPFNNRYAKDTVNGFPADIIIPNTVGKCCVYMIIPRVTEQNQFTIWGESIADVEMFFKIFKSIVFKNSDTSNNPPLTLAKFAFDGYGNGKKIFNSYCAGCHKPNKEFTGPPLIPTFNEKSSEWVYTFLTQRKKIKKDSLYISRAHQYGLQCLEFPDLTRNEVNLIVNYVKSFEGEY